VFMEVIWQSQLPRVGWKVDTAAKGSAKVGDVGLEVSVNYEHNEEFTKARQSSSVGH